MRTINVDSYKQPLIFKENQQYCLNISRLIPGNVENKLSKLNFSDIKHLNLCFLASSCYKNKIKYNSGACWNFINEILIAVHNKNVDIVQLNLGNVLEKDLLPFSKLFTVYEDDFYISTILKSVFKFLGYTDFQGVKLCQETNNILKLLPPDLLESIPMQTEENMIMYNKIKDLLSD